MSQHSNKRDRTPTSSRSKIRGANPTYKTSIQKQMGGDGAEMNEAGQGKETPKVEGEGSIPNDIPAEKNPGSNFGSAHYTPSK